MHTQGLLMCSLSCVVTNSRPFVVKLSELMPIHSAKYFAGLCIHGMVVIACEHVQQAVVAI
jgi:hypothetical protein